MGRDRLVVIGGDAADMSAASQARRLRAPTELDVVVLEPGPDVSYSACGIPYWVGGQVEDRDLSSAPPFSSTYDPVLVASRVEQG